MEAAATRLPLAAPARGAAAPARGTPPPARAASPQEDRGGRGPNFVFSVAADGLLRGLIPDTGDLAHRARQVPSRQCDGDRTDLDRRVRLRGDVEHVRRRADGGVRHGFHGRDQTRDDVAVEWRVRLSGLALGVDGTVYVSTGGGSSEYANSIVALDGETLKVKDWLTARLGIQLHAGRVQRRR